jgi:hypothetical protein
MEKSAVEKINVFSHILPPKYKDALYRKAKSWDSLHEEAV